MDDNINSSTKKYSDSKCSLVSDEDVVNEQYDEHVALLSNLTNGIHHNSIRPKAIHSELYHTPDRNKHTEFRSRSVTLEALKSHTPFESEAEAYLQSTLDELDRATNETTKSNRRQSIFGIDECQEELKQGTQNRKHRFPTSVSTNLTDSGASKLVNLARKLGKVYHESDKSLDELNTNANTLFSNAKTILKYLPHHTESTLDKSEEMTLTDRLSNLKGYFGKKNANPTEKGIKYKISTSEDETDLASDKLDDNDGNDVTETSSQQQVKYVSVSDGEQSFQDWLYYEKMGIIRLFKSSLVYIMLPSLALACTLFYGFHNPPCQDGSCDDKHPAKHTNDAVAGYFTTASMSWWFLFLGCRQVITFLLGRFTEDIFVDYFALRTSWSVRLFGPLFTLLIIQSKGWPCTTFFWCIFDLGMLFGKHPFAQHWLYYQDHIHIMSKRNPSGNIPDSDQYKIIVLFAMAVSFAVALKRVWLGLMLGRVTFARFSEELKKIMAHSSLVGKVAMLARDIERSNHRFDDTDLPSATSFIPTEGGDDYSDPNEVDPANKLSLHERRNLFAGINESVVRTKINELLGEWEEPEARQTIEAKPTIRDIIVFRQNTAYLNTNMPFGTEFGKAGSREDVIQSTEEIYERLMLSIPHRDLLTFDVLALLAVQKDGSFDIAMLRDLIKLFRPDRDGNLSLLDFAKSIDSIYKQIRLLRANIHNSSKMDLSFEGFFNFFFFLFVLFIFLAVVGVDPMLLFATVTSTIFSFAFIIGNSCSNFLNGLLMVFFRRPYDIGDRIASCEPYTDSPTTGSSGWVVQDIDIFTTTVVYGSTSEVATYANSALYTLRIINQTRSPLAYVSFQLKFGIDTPYEKIQVYKSSLEKFVRGRPREWARFAAFRTYEVEADQGYVVYYVGIVHREAWHNSLAIANSKAELQAFANELAKKMKIRYISPAMPIDLTLKNSTPDALQLPVLDTETTFVSNPGDHSVIVKSLAQMFGTELSP